MIVERIWRERSLGPIGTVRRRRASKRQRHSKPGMPRRDHQADHTGSPRHQAVPGRASGAHRTLSPADPNLGSRHLPVVPLWTCSLRRLFRPVRRCKSTTYDSPVIRSSSAAKGRMVRRRALPQRERLGDARGARSRSSSEDEPAPISCPAAWTSCSSRVLGPGSSCRSSPFGPIFVAASSGDCRP